MAPEGKDAYIRPCTVWGPSGIFKVLSHNEKGSDSNLTHDIYL